jgi:hypothetical protein
MSQMLKLMRGTALVAGLLALTAMESCSKIPIPEPQLEGVYGLELKQDTRRAALYKGLETRLWIHMVWLKPDLVAAQAAQLSLMRAEPPDVASARKEKMLAENADRELERLRREELGLADRARGRPARRGDAGQGDPLRRPVQRGADGALSVRR